MMVRVGKPGRYLTIGRGTRATFIMMSMGLLASCNPATTGSSPDGAQLDIMDKVRSRRPAAETAGCGRRRRDVRQSRRRQPPGDVSGNGHYGDLRPAPAIDIQRQRFRPQFRKHPGRDRRQGGARRHPRRRLHHRSRVQGTVSLVSIRPVAKSDIVFVLENALRLSGVVMIRDTAGYRLTPLGDAVGAGRVDAAGASPEPGFGVSVVPLQYVSAQTLLKLMDSFATKAGTVRADTTRNLLLIQGSGAERRAEVDTALSFDVDWMRGQSVGIFPITERAAGPVDHRTRKDRGFRRERSRPECHQIPADRPPQRHHGGQQTAGNAAHGGKLDQAARSRRYRANQRSRLPGEIWRCETDRAHADRHVHRRLVFRSAGQRRQPDRAGLRYVRDVKSRSPGRERQCIVDDRRLWRQQRIWNRRHDTRRHVGCKHQKRRQPARSTAVAARLPATGRRCCRTCGSRPTRSTIPC